MLTRDPLPGILGLACRAEGAPLSGVEVLSRDRCRLPGGARSPKAIDLTCLHLASAEGALSNVLCTHTRSYWWQLSSPGAGQLVMVQQTDDQCRCSIHAGSDCSSSVQVMGVQTPVPASVHRRLNSSG